MDLLENTEEAVRVHQLLGTTNAGIGGAPLNARSTVEGLMKFIDQANKAAEELAKHGMKFTYHNHHFEFNKFGNETMMDILVRELDPKNCSFVLDTYWLQHAGAFVNEWIEKLAGRVDILHLKDKRVKDRETFMAELGYGNMNFKSVMETAEKAGVKYYCYEQDTDHSINPLESAKVSAKYFLSELA
jgi:sugar phosphate isomerase/epimerase